MKKINELLYCHVEQKRWIKKGYYVINMFLARGIYWTLKKKMPSNIWLVSNGEDTFGNNAKVMYEYLQKIENLQLFWVCDGKSMEDLKKSGVTSMIKRGSIKNYLMAMKAQVGIYTHSDSDVAPKLYRWFSQKTLLVDLTHGNTGQKRLASDYIADFALDMWCCCSEFERKIIIESGCAPDKAVITGMARYDAFPAGNKEKKESLKILIMPTWREWYLNGDKDFINTELYLTYGGIIEFCKELGYETTFILHNTFSAYYKNDLNQVWQGVRVISSSAKIQQELIENDLLITDYSSLLWEFIYQGKPVILCWYDVLKYNSLSGKRIQIGGTYPEFEILMKDSICYDAKEVKSKLENFTKNRKLYIPDRTDFFQFTDRNNCQRIYLEILKRIQENSNE